MTPWSQGVVATNFNPRGIVGRIYEVNNYALLHTKYRRCGLHGFTLIFFLEVFQHYKSMEANDPQGIVNLDPRSMVDTIYIGGRQTLLYTEYKHVCNGPHVQVLDKKMFTIFSGL